MLVNLTGKDVIVVTPSGDEIDVCKDTLRPPLFVTERASVGYVLHGATSVPFSYRWRETTGLPPRRAGISYIVRAEVAEACPERDDFLVPIGYDLVRPAADPTHVPPTPPEELASPDDATADGERDRRITERALKSLDTKIADAAASAGVQARRSWGTRSNQIFAVAAVALFVWMGVLATQPEGVSSISWVPWVLVVFAVWGIWAAGPRPVERAATGLLTRKWPRPSLRRIALSGVALLIALYITGPAGRFVWEDNLPSIFGGGAPSHQIGLMLTTPRVRLFYFDFGTGRYRGFIACNPAGSVLNCLLN